MANTFLPKSVKKKIGTIIALVMTLIFFRLAVVRLDLTDDSFLTSMEHRWMDAKFRVRGQQPAGNEVVIVGLDEKTLDKVGSARTLRREVMADLVARLAAGGPKAIGFDILYEEPDTNFPEDDRKLAAAIQTAGNVVLGIHLDLESRTGRRREIKRLDPEFEKIIVEKQIFPAERRAGGGSRQIDALMIGRDLEMTVPSLTAAAASFGFVNFHADEEGRLRYQPQFIEYQGHLYPSLDLQILRRYLDAPSVLVDLRQGRIQQVQVGNKIIPTDQYGRFLLNFNGPRGTHHTVSMIDVLENHVPYEVFKDKIVLIGAPAVGLADIIATPFEAVLPGVELHANVIDNILHQQYLYRDGMTKIIDLAVILVFGFIISHFLPKLNATRSVFYTGLLLVTFTGFNVWAFLSLKWILSFVYPGLSLVCTSATLISYKYLTEEREKKRTKQTFQYYLDQHVIEQVMNQPELLKLGGEKRELTVLFSDIRGFTSFSEKMQPAEVVHFLNQYFDRMTSLIFKQKGTLDKLIGDAVMCFWGHPIETKDHALRGTLTALQMIQAVNELRSVLVLPGGAKFEIGIGINTGPMVVGNMGSNNRFSYTVMGDNVNLGSRLESLNKYYGTNIIISDSTFEAVKEFVFCRQLDTIQVKGKSQAVTIFEPMGARRLPHERRTSEDRRGELTPGKKIIKGIVLARHGERRQEDRRTGSAALLVAPEQEEIATMYEHALALYRNGESDAADMAFDHVLSLNPLDGPSRLMKTRIARYRTESGVAGAHFDPVYKFDEK
jgi:adenylate cyclase